MSYGTTTSIFHMPMCYAVPRPVQPSNVSCGTTTSAFHLAMYHTLPQPVLFIWQYVLRYHNQCLSPGNMSYGTMISAFHMAMYHTYHDQCLAPGNVSYGTTTSATWQCTIRYHDQCNMTMRHTVAQRVYFTWQYVIRYHDQCLSPGNVSYGTPTSAFHMTQRLKVRLQFWRGVLFQWLGNALWFSSDTAFERRH